MRRERDMKPEIAERIRRPSPGGHVMPGCLPVVSFGDPDTAQVATISLNPSPKEFKGRGGAWLLGDKRRLHSQVSLGRDDPQQLTDSEVEAVAAACRDYFHGNWYKPWFRWLESLMLAAEVGSYLDGSACHLDLVQWATDPAQAKLPAEEWARLVEEDLPLLRWQLDTSEVDIVLVNGASVVKGVQQAGLVDEFDSEFLDLPQGARGALKVHRAIAGGRLYLGWNKPVVGAIPAAQRQQLTDWLHDQITEWTAPTPAVPPPGGTAPEYIPAGTTVSLDELVPLLSGWASSSGASTIGDVGSFGGRALVTVATPSTSFVLNADTKRAAVLNFLAVAGVGAPNFRVVANQRGKVNRVVFHPDGRPTPGWYAYTPIDRPREEPL
jgi:hypothetical protein